MLTPARLSLLDVLRVGGAGLRARPARVVLSAVGIAIGIAAMISVVGISASSQEQLNRQLAALGTNLLRVGPGQSLGGDQAHLPEAAVAMIGRIGPDQQVWLGGRYFTVVGILAPVPLAPELDSAALVGWPAAEQLLGFDGYATTIYTRCREESVEAVRAVLPRTANPEHPNEVSISRPSDALAAKRAADATLNALLLGLGAVALLVGGVGVANTMVISVFERRAEIGLRRSLGATRGQIRAQFLAESALLSALGGAAGVFLGIAVTGAYAYTQGWPAMVPPWASVGGLSATLVIGAFAGLYPANRAARLSPTEALAAA